jgi:glycosyltransferase involved in cell wall biosynthesis
MKAKLVRITTVPISLRYLISGQPAFMQRNGFEVILISSEGPDWKYIEDAANFVTYKVEMARDIAVVKDVLSLLKLIWLFWKIKPGIVHSHTPKAGLLSMVASRITGVPIRVHTVAGLPLMEAKGIKRTILEIAEKITYRCASNVYPNSKNLQQFILQNKFCAANKLKVIGNGSSNGIDTTYFKLDDGIREKATKLKQELKISKGKFVFIFIGRVVRDKGIVELVKAFGKLRATFIDPVLLIVGPYEPERDPIPKSTRDLIETMHDIIHVGFQSDVRPYLALSDALVFPSYREGFPNVPMQAGCFDLPAIVTAINGCNEIIIDKKNGLLIPAKSVEALREAMEKIICDEDLYATCKRNARKMIVDRYEQRMFWHLLLNEYDCLVSNKLFNKSKGYKKRARF